MTDDGLLTPLDGRSSALFLLAGTLFAVFAALNWATAFTDVAYETVESVFGPGGFAVAFVGLLGLYPALADRSPLVARTGVLFATVGIVGGGAISLVSLLQVAGVTGEPAAWFSVFLLALLAGNLLGYLSFAAATLRTDAYPRTVGGLLLVPGVVFAAMVVGGAVTGGDQIGAVVISSVQTVALLAIGVALRTEEPSTGGVESAADATA